MLNKYKHMKELLFNKDFNFIFELYGKRNKILIDYDVSLDTRLLFAINTTTGNIIPPSNIDINLPKLNPIKTLEIKNNINLKSIYENLQEELENQLIIDEDKELIKGKEGYVLYFIKENNVTQIKNKPPSVLKYHWRTGAISYESIYTTIINAFENWDNPDFNVIKELLLEEFTEEEIEKSKVRIEKTLNKVIFDKKLKYEIMEFYNTLNLDFKKDKAKVMREMAKKYPKSMASKIYNLLAEELL